MLDDKQPVVSTASEDEPKDAQQVSDNALNAQRTVPRQPDVSNSFILVSATGVDAKGKEEAEDMDEIFQTPHLGSAEEMLTSAAKPRDVRDPFCRAVTSQLILVIGTF